MPNFNTCHSEQALRSEESCKACLAFKQKASKALRARPFTFVQGDIWCCTLKLTIEYVQSNL